MNVYIPGTGFATQGPAPEGFHVPLITEWQGLKTIMDGLSLTTGDSWRINLHMPFAGYRSNNANLDSQGPRGFYWSSSPYGSDSPYSARATVLYASSSVNTNNGNQRTFGFSVRCFKDSFELPTSSWTIINGALGGAGIFRDTVNGLISITSDGTTGYTIQDKNLGATIVYSDGDTLSEANCGRYYQWGNNYGFPFTGNVTKSSTQVDASSYGPGNYYSSSTYITGNYDWSSVGNDNLWGGIDGNVNVLVMNELKNAYIGEVYEYSYDFRGKSASQVTSDGYVTAAGTPAYNSNGFTSSNSSIARINKNIKSLANAKKITLSFTVVLGSGATGTGIRLMGANRTYSTGVLFDVNSNLCQYFIGGDKVTDSSGLSSGTHTTTIVLNLTDKTAVFSRTGKTDYSTSITDTQISNIKNNITLSEIYAGMSAGVISNWYILVE